MSVNLSDRKFFRISKFQFNLITICLVSILLNCCFANQQRCSAQTPIVVQQNNDGANANMTSLAPQQKDRISAVNPVLIKDAIKNDANTKEPNMGSLIQALFTVIILIFIAAWVYLKFNKIDPSKFILNKLEHSDSDKVTILSTTSIGQGQNIHLIKIKNKNLLIGCTANNVNLITEFASDDICLNNIAEKYETASSAEPSCDQLLKNDYASEYMLLHKDYIEQ